MLKQTVSLVLLYSCQCAQWALPTAVLVSVLVCVCRVKTCKKSSEPVDILSFFGTALYGFVTGYYAAFSLYVTLLMRIPGSRREVSMIPFHILLNWGNEKVFIVENILLFLPFGVLVYILLKEKVFPIYKTVISAGGLSLVIEILQFCLACGKTELDDVICNVIGAFIGAKIGCILFELTKRLMPGRDDVP